MCFSLSTDNNEKRVLEFSNNESKFDTLVTLL